MFKKIFLLAIFLSAPVIVFAGSNYIYDVGFIPESWENIIEFVNLIVAVLAAAYAVKLAALSQGGDLEKTWNLLAVVAVLFAILEIYGALKGLNLVYISGFGDVLEFVFGLTLLVAVYKTRKTLLKRVMG